MTMTKERKITYICVLVLVTVLFVLGGIFDLKLSDAVFQPENVMAKIFESAGMFPPFVIVAATFATLFFSLDEKKNALLIKRLVCVGGATASYLLFGYFASDTYLGSFLYRLIAALGTAAVLTPLTFLALRKVGEDKKKRLLLVLIFGSIVSVISTLLTANVLKFIWSRPRYYEMAASGSFAAYTPWFKINGMNVSSFKDIFTSHGMHSFPSSHVCAATNLFIFCAVVEVFPGDAGRERRIAFISALYVFIMAYSRIVVGAHFLSDVTGGFFIGFLTYAVARYFFFRKFGSIFDAPETEVVVPETETEKWDDFSNAELPEREEIEIAFGEESNGAEKTEVLTKNLEGAEDSDAIEILDSVTLILPTEEEEEDNKDKE